jgi:hypothetical protein
MNGTLAPGETHAWIYFAFDGDVITLTVGPASGVDLDLVVNDPNGTKVAGRDYAGAGGAETLVGLELDKTGEYQILINEVDGYAGDYGFVIMDEDSFNIRFIGNLDYGDTRSTILPARTYHLWHFPGSVGDNITISLSPEDNSDLSFILYGWDMDDEIERVDSNSAGGAEEASLQLAETDFYTIWIEVLGGGAAEYELVLTEG